MKIFDDMTFSGTQDALAKFIERLDQSPQIGPWMRDQEAVESHAAVRPAPDTDRCYRKQGSGDLPDALLWLIAREKRASKWRVTNIVPAIQNAAFSEDTYYSLLTSFRETTLPLARECNVTISLPQLDVGPEYWLTPKQEDLLRSFSEHANRSTGSAHPQDQKRWNDFVIKVHHDGSNVGGGDIGRILIEHYHWSEHIADELAIDFDKQRALLRDFAKSA